ncbi:MAG: hypothetical protein A2045_17010 [Rhodocyclales bacterium GWA2_65_20]|nr:MAG: hypothetical protein A2045_17010 [Rhodocyclales bacterium GWA2_65_20]
MAAIPCAIVRGGTSKGVFLLDEHLPADRGRRDRVLLELMGSPDPRQIDGLGGADPLTSKVAIVSRSRREGIDVEYESVEVGIAEAQVNHGLMCGNLIAGVGYFAIAEGLIAPRFPSTTVNIYCRTNHKTIVAKVPVAPGGPVPDGDAMVSLVFANPGGAITGKLLPAGDPVSRLALAHDESIEVSIVDAGTLYAFVRADALGVTGHESAATLDGDAEFRTRIEVLRGQVADCINRHNGPGAAAVVPRLVKMAVVAPPGPQQGDADIVARVVNSAKVHKAYAVSGGICLAAAAAIPGTLVNAVTRPAASPFLLRIGHPSGILPLRTYWSKGVDGVVIHGAEIQRSARIILRGTAYVFSDTEPSQPMHAADGADAHTAGTPVVSRAAVEA